MNLVRKSLENLVWFYKDKLEKVDSGTHGTKVFNSRERIHLKKHGVLTRDWNKDRNSPVGSKTILTDEAKEILDELDERVDVV